jgi:glycine/serine hydroxymethyltransferase
MVQKTASHGVSKETEQLDYDREFELAKKTDPGLL